MKNFGFMGLAVLMALVGIYLKTSGHAGYDLMAFLAAGCLLSIQVVVIHTRRGVAVTAALAAACNAYLLNLKFSPDVKAACSVSEKIDCGVINTSAYSEAMGMPIVLFGVAFYVGLLLASFASPKRAPRFDQINGLFALVALAYSAFLAYVAYGIGAVCIMCITIYVCNAILLGAAFKGLYENGLSLFSGVDKIFGEATLWIIAATFGFITLVGSSSWNDYKDRTALPTSTKITSTGKVVQEDGDAFKSLYRRPQGPIQLDGTEPVLGDPNAPITIVEFADYMCPHCAQASPVLKKLVAEYPEVQLKFKAFPLNGICNDGLQPDEETMGRCKAAMAAECAGKFGKYYDLSGLMFTNLGYNEDHHLTQMATQVGLDLDAFQTCMNDPATLEAVKADATAGRAAKIQGTPAIFIQGLVPGGWVELDQSPQALFNLVEARRDGVTLSAPQ